MSGLILTSGASVVLITVMGGCAFDTSAALEASDNGSDFFSPDAGGQPDAQRSLTPDAASVTDPDAAPTIAPGTLQSFNLTGPLNMDGELDAAWLAHPFISYNINQAGQLMSVPGYANDAVLRFASRYDADKIYFFLEVSDGLLITNSSDLYNDDSIELYIDGLNDRAGPYADDDHWLVIGENGTYESLGPNAIDLSGFIKSTSVGYNIEIAIQRDELGASGSATTLGFNVGINDDDDMGDSGVDGYGLWHLPMGPSCSDCCTGEDGDFAWCDTTRLGQLELLP